MSEDRLLGSVLENKYRILRLLGEGAMGRVYLAENIQLPDIRYAIKVLKSEFTDSNPQFKEEFTREAQRHAKLQHPNIVHVNDYSKTSSNFFLVLAFVDGQALSDLLDDAQGPLPEKRALSIIKDVLSALNFAHENALVHQDVKSPNILIDSFCARITDFGIARELANVAESDSQKWIGTPDYMSPEQYISPNMIDHRSDVYSAGVVLFEMLTGQLPFSGETSEEILRKHVDEDVPDPRRIEKKISKPLARIVLKALAKDPEQRYQGCQEFLLAIEAYERRNTLIKTIIFISILTAIGAMTYAYLKPQKDAGVNVVVKTAFDNMESVCLDVKLMHGNFSGIKEIEGVRKAIQEQRQSLVDYVEVTNPADVPEWYHQEIQDMEQEIEAQNSYIKNIQKQIQDNERTIKNRLRKYSEAIANLQKFDSESVEEVVKMERAGSANRTLYGDYILGDRVSFNPSGEILSIDGAIERCKIRFPELSF